jgi:hypothetical protein
MDYNIKLNVAFNERQHDREIRLDNGWKIKVGRGVERRVPLLPFSREIGQLDRLKKDLALYRLVFGQPRQEGLLAYLGQHLSKVEAEQAVSNWTISLAP